MPSERSGERAGVCAARRPLLPGGRSGSQFRTVALPHVRPRPLSAHCRLSEAVPSADTCHLFHNRLLDVSVDGRPDSHSHYFLVLFVRLTTCLLHN